MDQDEEDTVQLLDEAEALELVEFYPSMDPKDTWEPPSAMTMNFFGEAIQQVPGRR